MRRVTPVPQPDASCSLQRSGYSTHEAYTSTLKPSLERYSNPIANLKGEDLIRLRESKDPVQNQSARDALDNLIFLENGLDRAVSCLSKDLLQRTTEASKIYNLQSEIEALRKEVEAKKQSVEEAKERSNLLDNPYSKTTWWESWFPLGRPIRKENVPVLLSVSILMLIFSLGMFLKMAGWELRLESITQSSNSLFRNLNSRKYQ